MECAYHRPYFQHGGGLPRLKGCGKGVPVLFWLPGVPLQRRVEGYKQQALIFIRQVGLYNRKQRSAMQQQKVSIVGWAWRMRGRFRSVIGTLAISSIAVIVVTWLYALVSYNFWRRARNLRLADIV